MRHAAALIAGIASLAAAGCGGGGGDEPSTTPRAAYRSEYPCRLLTPSMAQQLLSVGRLRRIGAQTLGPGVEQCLYARGRHKGAPLVGLVVHADDRGGAEDSFARMQRRISDGFAQLRRRRPKVRTAARYRELSGLGDRAFLVSGGANEGEVFVAQGGRSFQLRMILRSDRRALLAALERTARRISARFDPGRVSGTGRSS